MEVITLNSKEYLESCNKMISKLEVQPDLIVGILKGGGYILENIKEKIKGSNFQLVKLKREKKFINFLKSSFILKILPYSVLNKLRIYESFKSEQSIDSLSFDELSNYQINSEINGIDSNIVKDVLIIDDAIDTGRTMFIVKHNLNTLFPNAQIKTAVISWTIEKSIVKPDYYLFKNVLIRFPWSKDYKGKDFEKKSFSS